MNRRLFPASTLLAALISLCPLARSQAPTQTVHNVVLVHGAWADGSSWAKVIPLLQARGLHVVSVQIPLTSLADDVAITKRMIDAQDGPVLLVGHSYGGAVITEAGNDPKVAGLVYVAAYAPDQGQSTATQRQRYPATAGRPEIKPLADGFLIITPKGISEDFAPDLTPTEKAVLTAVQIPTQKDALSAVVTDPAWKKKPSWFVVAANDRIIQPAQERDEAKAMHAKTLELSSSHVVMLAHPREVAEFIFGATSSR